MAQAGSVGMYPIYIPISGNAAHGLPGAYMNGMKPMPQPFIQPVMQPAAQPVIYQAPPDVYQSSPPAYSEYPMAVYPTASGPIASGQYAAMPAPTVSMAQQGVYGGIQNHGVQQYLPISEKRQMDSQEDVNIQTGLKQWWPKIGAGYATPMHELLANPYKSAAISALFLGALAGLAGFAMLQPRRLFALAGLVLGSFIGAFSGYINRRQQNENILDLMQRFPQGATKRDMLSDPVYQSDLNRAATARASGGGGDMLAGALIGSAFSSGYGNRRS